MKKELLFGISGLVVGALTAGWVATLAVNNNNTGMMKMMGMHTLASTANTMNNDDMTMSQMTTGLQGKTGDTFDKAFLGEMIMHHQGAISMANLVKANAKHDEIKAMANDIVDAQTKEINQMQSWQAEWGYTSPSSNHDMMNIGR